MSSFITPIVVLFTSLMLLVGGCASRSIYHPEDDPPPLPVCFVPKKVKVALVLGGGGAKGLAHLGVLEEFENAGIAIDIIVGCSAGSLVGALYCDCPDAAYLKTVLEPISSKRFVNIHYMRAFYCLGLSQEDGMTKVLNECLEAKYFHQLKIPLLTVSTDLYSGELIILGGGPIIPAVEASCAFPLVFSPVCYHGRILVDGGCLDPVPVQVAKMVEPEIVIAVELCSILGKSFPKNILGVAQRSADITLLWQTERCLHDADFIIRPEVDSIGTFEDCPHEKLYDAGRKAALKVIPSILERLRECQEKDMAEGPTM
ncbi:MAG TPA: patatin-like phospholipase family protein [Parachlamydiaceae bacterium]|nr:patatin-like phospholipase family protein [Parachlamydiaceae bacterium]HEV8051787.1 patatin-like phospholipase family protein [Parachlamydiaceae bacterium]